MGRYCHIKSGFSRPPAKGTKNRKALIMMLRGATAPAIIEACEFKGASPMSRIVMRLRDECGYDIRHFPNPTPNGKCGRTPGLYKVIGKMKWDGSYRSFINDDVEAFFAKEKRLSCLRKRP